MSSNRDKSSEVRQFKGSAVFDWDHEPSTMRETGFEQSTVPTGWGESRLEQSPLRARKEASRARRRGFVRLAIALLVVIAASAAILYDIARMVHA